MPDPFPIAFRHRLTGHNAAIFALTKGEEDAVFYSASGDGWIVRWDLRNPELGKLVAEAPEQVFSLCYLPDRKVIVAGTMNGQVNWIDLEDGDRTRRFSFHQKGVFDIRQVGNFVYTLGGGGLLTRWDPETIQPVESLQLSRERLRSLSHSAARNELAIGASDGNIYLVDATDFTFRKSIEEAHEHSAFSVVYTPDGQKLVSGGRDARLKKWDPDQPDRPEIDLPAHRYTINDLAISPDGQFLATASRDRSIRIWDLQKLELLKVLEAVRDKGHLNSVNRILWSSHEDMLVSASDDRTIILWSKKLG